MKYCVTTKTKIIIVLTFQFPLKSTTNATKAISTNISIANHSSASPPLANVAEGKNIPSTRKHFFSLFIVFEEGSWLDPQ